MSDLRKRLPLRSSRDTTGENARVLDALERNGNALTIVRLLANSPNGFVPYVQMSNALLNRAALPARHRELAILHIATVLPSAYEWAEHVRMSDAAGVGDDERRAIREGDLSSPLFDDSDRLAMELAARVGAGPEVDGATWDRAVATWGVEGLLDLVLTAAWWGGFVPVVIGALGLEAEDAALARGGAG